MIDLPEFDFVVAGLSGGKDSTALALWLVFESGVDRAKIKFQTADTHNEDPLTYAFLDYLREIVGEIVIDNETGEPMRVCTMYDVAEWSRTAWGANQYQMFFPDEQAAGCLIGGECE
ncbi:MAG TPA: hypothetical protein PLZ16_16445 [Gammaproteobacteria bacterium]|nr:hypothetical protein [Gammaproteobacteria bacterium]